MSILSNREIICECGETFETNLLCKGGNAYMYAGTKFNWYDNSAITVSTTATTLLNAPLFLEYPLSIECEVDKFTEDGILVGKIINVSIDESILTDGKPDPKKLEAISFDPANNNYLLVNEIVAQAFKAGLSIK